MWQWSSRSRRIFRVPECTWVAIDSFRWLIARLKAICSRSPSSAVYSRGCASDKLDEKKNLYNECEKHVSISHVKLFDWEN